MVDVVDVAGDHHGATRDREHALARAEDDMATCARLDRLEGRGAKEAAPVTGGDRPNIRVDRNRVALRGALAVGQDDRNEILLEGVEALVVVGRIVRVLGQLGVHLRVELVPHHEVRRRAGQSHHDGHHTGRNERQAGAKRHGSRST